METCIRGFSYMPEKKIEMNMQFIEDGELERAWKVTRRQRMKDQEQKIWEEFVKEQDIVKSVCSEDPYQFLQELPETCLKELLETELIRMKKESEATVPQPSHGEGDQPSDKQAHMVTFTEDERAENMDMFHIFDDDNEIDQSGEEDQEPATVRERESDEMFEQQNELEDLPPSSPSVQDGATSPLLAVQTACTGKPVENLSHVIESSIYCARVKDIRLKITEEMTAIMASLEVQNVMSIERSEVSRRCKRATEFCGRFNRIYMYQLQRQMSNIKRQISQSLPLAMHTQFQSQMLRVVSLHQNMLQALQVFHKSFSATSCLRASARALLSLSALVREASVLCQQVPPPRNFVAAHDLYNDEVLATCDKLDEAVNEHNYRVADFLSSSEIQTDDAAVTPSTSRTKKVKSKKGTSTRTMSQSYATKDTEGRLSMYSFDTMRLNLHPKSSTSKENHSSGTSKCRVRREASSTKQQQMEDKTHEKTSKKCNRRPLMRAPQSGGARACARAVRDTDILTLVESVDTCESSQNASRERTPRHTARPRVVTRKFPSPKPKEASKYQMLSPAKAKSRRASKSPKQSPVLKNSPYNLQLQAYSATGTNYDNDAKDECTDDNKYSDDIRQCCPKKLSDCNTSPKLKSPISPITKIQFTRKTQDTKDTDQPQDERNANKLAHGSPLPTDRSQKSTDISTDREKAKKLEKIDLRPSPRDISTKEKEKTKKKRGKDEVDITVKNIKTKSFKYKKQECIDEFCGVKELTDNNDDYSRDYAKEVEEEKCQRSRAGSMSSRCGDVSWLLRQLCSGDPSGLGTERVTGAKNAQLLYVNSLSPAGKPSTPQLLRILEETIQKQTPRPVYESKKPRNVERFRLNFNIGEATASSLFQYRTKFVQHMLTSPLYANSAVGKPWEMIGGVSDKIIDELLTLVANEMEIKDVLQELYRCETT